MDLAPISVCQLIVSLPKRKWFGLGRSLYFLHFCHRYLICAFAIFDLKYFSQDFAFCCQNQSSVLLARLHQKSSRHDLAPPNSTLAQLVPVLIEVNRTQFILSTKKSSINSQIAYRSYIVTCISFLDKCLFQCLFLLS